MTDLEYKESIYDILKNLHGLNPLKELLGELDYERVNEPLSRHGWTDTAATALAEDPILFASDGEGNDFHIIYSRLASDRLLLGLERPVVTRLLRDHPYVLFIFSNSDQDRWHFLNVKYDQETHKRRLFRRITIGPEERLRTATERLQLLDLRKIKKDSSGLSPLIIQEKHDEAFDVEAVTEQFFKEYKLIFNDLQKDLEEKSRDQTWAHDYALQFLNRTMFLYFVQRKGWLGGDMEFLGTFWRAYKETHQPKDTF
ncbi:MAG: class I SAM-dependent DNA methyltransferase, partial [Deltaproteobacteria bacterium]|nr:class I SAM-dependent DNA methyltransferase [Deltaproteobacteria bacterium]